MLVPNLLGERLRHRSSPSASHRLDIPYNGNVVSSCGTA
ncbi:hypothetical protein [Alloactinosynnema sp. L-07]|nr:hypothetical protein [Alloactinosynnema sp. L-07]